MTTSFIAATVNSFKLTSGYQLANCAQAECLYLPIWEKLLFALGGNYQSWWKHTCSYMVQFMDGDVVTKYQVRNDILGLIKTISPY